MDTSKIEGIHIQTHTFEVQCLIHLTLFKRLRIKVINSWENIEVLGVERKSPSFVDNSGRWLEWSAESSDENWY